MKRSILVAGAAAALAYALATPAHAQTFPPDAKWVPLTRNGVVLYDPQGDAQGARDIVGDAQNPSAYVYRDAAFLYFRLRVDDTPLQSAGSYKPFGWGAELNINGDLTTYQYLAMLNGIANPDHVELDHNTVQSTLGNARDPAEVVLATYPTATHAESKQAPSNFGGTPDYFVDWAIDLKDLQAAGVDLKAPVRFIFGTSNNAQTLASDLLAPSGGTQINQIASDPVNCSGTSCVPCSALCGASCVQCGGVTPKCNGTKCVECVKSTDCPASKPVCDATSGTCVASTSCTKDADCKNPALPACQPGGTCGECSSTNQSHCTGTRPVCDVASGSCVPGAPCKSDTDCTDPALPACQPDGTCGQCSASNDIRCVGTTPVCDTATGVCVAGCKTDADCRDPALPACQPDGTCGQCSKSNQSVCTGTTPKCDTPAGRCGEACKSDADCTDPARPACEPDGVCGECSATNKKLCTGSRPVCDTATDQCVGGSCKSDADCKDTALPACESSGQCGQCSATNSDRCTGKLSACDTSQGICVAGSAQSAPTATFEGGGCALSGRGGDAGFAFLGLGLLGMLLGRRRRRRRRD